MLNKPKFMIPSTNMQECTIDANSNNLMFSCIVDGNESIHAWRIRIYELESDTTVYDTGKVTKANGYPTLPFFPVNEKNQNIVFRVNLKDYPSNSASGFANSTNPYRWTIEFWNSDTSSAKATTTSCEEVFYANATPEVVLFYKSNDESEYHAFPTDGAVAILNANDYSFKAEYTSSYKQNGIQIKRYGWRITDKDSGQILVDTITHNQVYGTQDNMVCSYSGFLNNGNYFIGLYLETQNNSVLTTQPIFFSVYYPTTFLSNDFSTEVLKTEPAIMLNWEKSVVIGGRESGGKVSYKENYPVVSYNEDGTPSGSGSVVIPSGTSIIYDYGASSNLNIEENCDIVISTQLTTTNNMVIFSAEGEENGVLIKRELSYIDGSFIYTVFNSDGELVEKAISLEDYMPNPYVWYVIIMSQTGCTVNVYRAEGGLTPSANLTPSAKLTPSFGSWVYKERLEAE